MWNALLKEKKGRKERKKKIFFTKLLGQKLLQIYYFLIELVYLCENAFSQLKLAKIQFLFVDSHTSVLLRLLTNTSDYEILIEYCESLFSH